MERTVLSPLGPLVLRATEHGLSALQIGSHHQSMMTTPRSEAAALHLDIAEVELERYFNGELTQFSVALDLQGTPFQQQVWQALQAIPFGRTCSYGELAAAIDNPKASRAVGMANGKNPVAIIVPCHRVIGQQGKLTGYAYGVDAKAWLLNLESTSNN